MSIAVEVSPLNHPPDISIEVPGSKSHTNRALICAALASGRSTLRRVLFADDTDAMLGALTALGVGIETDPANGTAVIHGGLADHSAGGESPLAVDARQSGTTSRFLLPLLATTNGRFILDGHPQIRSRPFGPQLEALRSLGADIEGDRLPLSIAGRTLDGAPIEVASDISSQFLSGLLLSAPRLLGSTTIDITGELVSRPYIDLTLATMASFGVEVQAMGGSAPSAHGQRFVVDHSPYTPADLDLEPDASAASYFFAAAAVTNGRVRIRGLGLDTVQGDLRFVHLLERMGADVTMGADWTEVRGTGRLNGITADMADVSDTAQTLAVVASFADSPTEITGVGFIKFKETDRIAAVATELQRRGIDAVATDDGWVINPGVPTPGEVQTYEDHRMAMSFALLGLRHPGIKILNPGCVTKTFPDFFSALEQLRLGP